MACRAQAVAEDGSVRRAQEGEAQRDHGLGICDYYGGIVYHVMGKSNKMNVPAGGAMTDAKREIIL